MFKSLNKGISSPIAIVIIIILSTIVIGGMVYYQYYKAPKEEEQPVPAQGESESFECKIYRKDFGVLKFFEEDYTKDRKAVGLGILEAFLGVYSSPSGINSPTGASDAFRVVIQVCENEKNCNDLKNDIFEQAKKSYSVEVIEKEYNGGKYIRTVKASEGTRYYWTSGNKFIILVAELPSKTIEETTNLEDSWNQLVEFYLNVCSPTK